MEVIPTWSMFGWVYLAHFLLGLLIDWQQLFSINILSAVMWAAIFALEVSAFVMLGVWMYKLDHRKRLQPRVNTPTENIE